MSVCFYFKWTLRPNIYCASIESLTTYNISRTLKVWSFLDDFGPKS